jgi:hypothetical protein
MWKGLKKTALWIDEKSIVSQDKILQIWEHELIPEEEMSVMRSVLGELIIIISRIKTKLDQLSSKQKHASRAASALSLACHCHFILESCPCRVVWKKRLFQTCKLSPVKLAYSSTKLPSTWANGYSCNFSFIPQQKPDSIVPQRSFWCLHVSNEDTDNWLSGSVQEATAEIQSSSCTCR